LATPKLDERQVLNHDRNVLTDRPGLLIIADTVSPPASPNADWPPANPPPDH
jgi:hypothetical protein